LQPFQIFKRHNCRHWLTVPRNGDTLVLVLGTQKDVMQILARNSTDVVVVIGPPVLYRMYIPYRTVSICVPGCHCVP
jgi:hypothetical protein